MEFEIKEASTASVEIINATGQLVYQNKYLSLSKGNQKLLFGKTDVDLASGLYIVRVVTNEFNETAKLIME